MTVDWTRVKELVSAALALEDRDRAPFLRAQCGADAPLLHEVESLLDGALRAGALFEDPVLLVGGVPLGREALAHLSTLSLSSILPSLVSGSASPPPAFAGTSRYRLLRAIGAGGMGVVYEVEDRARGQIVALKTLQRWEPGAIYRLKREFRTLAGIAHRNLVSLYDLVAGESECFFTMELVPGVTFVEYARHEDDRVDLDRLRLSLPQLVEGILALHREGRLHRDIKPSNVLVTAEGRVVILDFGLTSDVARAASSDDALAGTPAYLSPEQCLGEHAREASDWYSVGVTLYHALTGAVPYESGPGSLVARKQTMDVVPPSAIAPGIPQDLETVCLGLLCRDPARRLTGHEVLEHLRAPIPTLEGPASMGFVGRQTELGALDAAFDATIDGRGASLCIHGPSGIGKSALVQAFLSAQAARAPFLALRGRCHEHEAVPYKGLDGVIDGLSRHLTELTADERSALLPADSVALARLFPVMAVARATGTREPDAAAADPQELRRTAFEALRVLLARLASRQPLVVEIDDFHWADVDSAAVLMALMRPPHPPPLLLILSFRTEEIGHRPFLRDLLERLDTGTRMTLPLEAMTAADTTRLIDHVLSTGRPLDLEARQAIAREAAGNPYLAEELARHAALGSTAGEGATLDQMLRMRVASLPADARGVLETLAVCGRPIVAGHLFAACGLTGDERPLVARLSAAHLVRASRSPDCIEMYHDRIREALAAGVSTEARRAIHERLSDMLVARGEDDPEALFTHHRGAGRHALAAAHAAEAAARAAGVLAFDRAVTLYREAVTLRSGDVPLDWSIGLAKALENAGRPADAAEAYLSAAAAASGSERVEWLRKGAEQLLIGGHIDRGLAIVNDVMRAIDLRPPRSPRTALLSVVVRRAELRWRGLDFVPRDESQVDAADLLRIDTCWAITTGLAMVDNIRAASFHVRQLLIALDAGEPYRVARAIALESGFSALGGGSAGMQRTLTYSTHARALAGRVGHPHAMALCALCEGVAAFVLGQWRRSTSLCDEALQLLRDRCVGVVWEQSLAQTFYLGSLLFSGELRDVAHWLPGLLHSTRERGNLYFETELRTRMNLVWLGQDRADEGEREANEAIARWSATSFHRQHYNHLLARVQTALYRDRAHDAWALLTAELPPVRRALWMRVQFMRIEASYMRARAALAMAGAGRDARRMRATAEADASSLAREDMPWSNPLARLIRAAIASQTGDADTAAALLTEAIDAFDAADMQLYAAVARRRLAALVGGERGRSLARAAEEYMAVQEIRNPPAMTRLLAPGFAE